MAYSDNYPNGYKSGYSSADDPDRPLRADVAEDIARENMARYANYVRLEEESQKERAAAIERQTQNNIEAANRIKDDNLRREENRERSEQVAKIIVQQKKDEYNKKSWLGKAFTRLRGKSPKQMSAQINNAARNKAINMTPEQQERFIEKYSGGKSR